ncbi:hypothetical protein BDW62DRAFT_174982 [Aspergillus aurantiobrunneus]
MGLILEARSSFFFRVCSLLKAVIVPLLGGAVAEALSKGSDSDFSLLHFLISTSSSRYTVMCWFNDDIPIIESSPETPTTVWGR